MASGERSSGGGRNDSGERGPATAPYLAALLGVAVIAMGSLALVTALREAHAASWAGIAIVEARGEVVGASLPEPGGTGGAMSDPLSNLARGVRQSANIAALAIERGQATAAAVATDAAMRAADVGRYAASGSTGAAFGSALRAIRDARHARQNGDRDGALAALRRAGREISSATDGSAGGAARTTSSAAASYEGARLIDATGRVIGLVRRVLPAAQGAVPHADLVLGGYSHVLGLFDVGGERVTVPADHLVFGEPRGVGPVVVALTSAAGVVTVSADPPR